MMQNDQNATENSRGSEVAGKVLLALGVLLLAAGIAAGCSIPLLLLGAAVSGGGGALRSHARKALRQQVNDTVVPDVLQTVFLQPRFEPSRRLRGDLIAASGLPLPRYTDCTGGEYVCGVYRGMEVELSSITLLESYEIQNEESNQWETRENVVYAGQWLVCCTGAAQPVDLMLAPRGKLDRIFRTKRMETGDEAFDKRFNVSADEDTAARRFLTQDRMERLIALADAAGGGLSVRLLRDGTLYLAVQSGHGFFDIGKGRESAELLRQRFTEELRCYTKLIDLFCPA